MESVTLTLIGLCRNCKNTCFPEHPEAETYKPIDRYILDEECLFHNFSPDNNLSFQVYFQAKMNRPTNITARR